MPWLFARCPFLTSCSMFGHIWLSGGLMWTIGENIDNTAFTFSALKNKGFNISENFFRKWLLGRYQNLPKKNKLNGQGHLKSKRELGKCHMPMLLCTIPKKLNRKAEHKTKTDNRFSIHDFNKSWLSSWILNLWCQSWKDFSRHLWVLTRVTVPCQEEAKSGHYESLYSILFLYKH